MKTLWPIFSREFSGYFATPLAYVFLVIFLLATGAFTFYIGRFFDSGVADLSAFFYYLPWLFLFLVPAIAMRLWAEERKSGTIELLMTLPVPLWAVVFGKFLAAWLFLTIALLLTCPLWVTVNYLGSPDNGVILAGYIGALFMAGSYLAIGAAVSALTKNQVVAFVIAIFISFLFTVSGAPLVLDLFSGWAPITLIEAVSSLSMLTHFQSIAAGVLDLRDIFFFVSLIALALFANAIIVDMKKAG